MIIEVPATAVPYVWDLIQARASELRRNGWELRPDVAEFAAALVRTADRDADRDALARARALSAARSRRYRAKRRSVTTAHVALRRLLSRSWPCLPPAAGKNRLLGVGRYRCCFCLVAH
jgi:hypothetical protein